MRGGKIVQQLAPLVREFASGGARKERKVAVLGAAGGIGQPLSLLMKVRLGNGVESRAPGVGWGAVSGCMWPDLPVPRSQRQPPATRAPQMNPAVSSLSLYDVANVKGVASDISHVNTKAKTTVRGARGPHSARAALAGDSRRAGGDSREERARARARADRSSAGTGNTPTSSPGGRASRAPTPWATRSRAATWSSSPPASRASPA